ncbi:MAG: DnaJ domain-containing protein [Nocardioides sp.]|nr:DnaJ domain-containing protein [Nocardioides sp.]
MTGASWYDVLGVDATASADEIRVAWRSAVSDLDPTDRRFRVLSQAAEVLLDDDRRAAYDAEHGVAVAAEEPVVEESATEEPEPAAETRSGARSWWAVPGWLLTAVAGLTAVSVAFVLVLLTRPSEASVENDTQAAQAAAERAVVPLLSYDARHLDQSHARATPYLTDNERQQYDKLFAVIRQNAPRTGTVVRAKYLASGIVRSGTDRVDVLVFVNQMTTNKQHPKTPVDYKNQVTVTMAKVGDQWLVDNLTTNTGRS